MVESFNNKLQKEFKGSRALTLKLLSLREYIWKQQNKHTGLIEMRMNSIIKKPQEILCLVSLEMNSTNERLEYALSR